MAICSAVSVAAPGTGHGTGHVTLYILKLLFAGRGGAAIWPIKGASTPLTLPQVYGTTLQKGIAFQGISPLIIKPQFRVKRVSDFAFVTCIDYSSGTQPPSSLGTLPKVVEELSPAISAQFIGGGSSLNRQVDSAVLSWRIGKLPGDVGTSSLGISGRNVDLELRELLKQRGEGLGNAITASSVCSVSP